MATWDRSSRSITDRLEALKFELKAAIAQAELRLTDRIAASALEIRGWIEPRFERLESRFESLAQDFKEFRGTTKGVAVVISTLVPIVTALAVLSVNILTKRMGLQ